MKKNMRLRIFYTFILTFLLILTMTMFYQCTLAKTDKIGASIGNTAPDFTLKDINEKNVKLSAIYKQNKATLLNFWGIWCPYCVREIPELNEFYRKYHSRGLEILGIDVGDSPGQVPAFVKKQQMKFPVLLDKNNSVSNLYRVNGFPTTFIMDRSGKIIDIIIGATNQETLVQKTKSLLR